MNNSHVFGAAFLVFIWAIGPQIAAAADVPRWSTYDIDLSATGSYANAYSAGPFLNATFTGPGGITKTVSGFWDGGTTTIEAGKLVPQGPPAIMLPRRTTSTPANSRVPPPMQYMAWVGSTIRGTARSVWPTPSTATSISTARWDFPTWARC